MPARSPQFRHREGWWGRLILQIRKQEQSTFGWVWGQWKDARISDLALGPRGVPE